MIDFGNGQHKGILGMTGTGKTYTTTRELLKQPLGVFFFNTMRVPMPRGFVRSDGKANFPDLMDLIESGKKVNFLPAARIDDKAKQIGMIIDSIGTREWSDFIFVVDEIHLYQEKAKQSLIQGITTMRNNGGEFVWLSQRMARVDNTFMTQSPYKVIFSLENEDKYMHNYGIPYSDPLDSGVEAIKPRLLRLDPGGKNSAGKYEPSHAYCTYFMGQIGGAYKYA